MSLYTRAVREKKALYFVDKTPRNYLILDDIKRIFPDSKIIFLLRHPLAIFSSLLDSLNWDWSKLLTSPGRRLDLVAAPRLISQAIDEDDQPIVVHYEDLIASPRSTMETLCGRLGVEFHSRTLTYEPPDETVWCDPVNIRNHSGPVNIYAGKWSEELRRHNLIGLAQAYIETFDRQTLLTYRIEKESMMSELDGLGARGGKKRWSKIWARYDSTERLAGPGARGRYIFQPTAAFLVAKLLGWLRCQH